MSLERRLAAFCLVFSTMPTLADAQVAYIDVHAHLIANLEKGQSDYRGAARVAFESLEQFGGQTMILMPQPLPAGHRAPHDADELLDAVKPFGGRLRVIGGGGILNPLIHEAARAGQVSDEMRQTFVRRAERLAALPIVGFGEFAAEHFSFSPQHPYVSYPADHPLMLALSDVAARHDLPIDLHMEAIAEDMVLPSNFRSPPNPAKFGPNIPALERLLAHNRATRIVWAHAGWDNTGQRTAALTRRLLADHANLYVNTKVGQDSLPQNRLAERGQGVTPEWRAVMAAFPDRFMVASDQHHVTPMSNRRMPKRENVARGPLNSLPAELAQKIGVENPLRVYPRLRP